MGDIVSLRAGLLENGYAPNALCQRSRARRRGRGGGLMSALEPNRDQLENFVDALPRHRGEEGYISLQSLLNNNKLVKPIRTVKLKDANYRFLIDAAEDQVRRAANEPNKPSQPTTRTCSPMTLDIPDLSAEAVVGAVRLDDFLRSMQREQGPGGGAWAPSAKSSNPRLTTTASS
jgi:hypothetical protein